MAAANTRVLFEEFDVTQGDIDTYLDRLDQYFVALDFEDENKKRAILLSSLGEAGYTTIRDLCFPDKPNTKSYEALTTMLKEHYKPTRLTISERFIFRNTKQTLGQTISQFVSHLKKKAIYCGFEGDALQNALRDQFVCGLLSSGIQKKLLTKNHTFKEAVNIALAAEAATANMKDMSNVVGVDKPIHKVTSSNRNKHKVRTYQSSTTTTPQARKCERCGMTNHTRETCKYKNATCFKCQKQGHLQSECKGAKFNRKSPGHNYSTQRKFVKQVTSPTDDNTAEDEEFVDSVFNVRPDIVVPAITVTMRIEEVDIDLEVVSVISYNDYKNKLSHLQLKPVTRSLHAYAGTKLDLAGEIDVNVDHYGQKMVLPMVVINAQRKTPPLLGRTWLEQIKLDWKSLLPPMQAQYSVAIDENVGQSLKEKFPDVFKTELGTVKEIKANLHLKEGAIPKFCKARNVPFALRSAVETELSRMQEEGVIYPVKFSDWATPLVCIPKSDGKVRVCGDYKVTVNPNLHCDQYPIPTPNEVFSNLRGGQRFSKVDWKCAYQQLVLEDKAQKLVTINTHRGLYRYTRLPFGISSSPAIWQRFIEQVIAGLNDTCAIMDDVLVTGSSDAEHISNLEMLFERFQKYGLRVKAEKCAFLQTEVVYMGRKLSASGIQPTADKVNAIKDAPEPRNATELRSWLGLVNYHASFIPRLSTMIHPLNELLGIKPWTWNDDCSRAFNTVKQTISEDMILTHYDPLKRLELYTDASPYGVGAVICHADENGKRPIAYASRSLHKHEKGYAQLDKEALGIMFGLQRFRTYLYGRKFTIFTDHKPLERILGPKSAIPTLAAQRLQRWAIILSAFEYDLKFIPGKQNVIADALSRLPVSDMGKDDDAVYNIAGQRLDSLPVTSSDVRRYTRTNSLLGKVLQMVRTGLWQDGDDDLKPFMNRRNELSIEQDCLLWGYRVVIPPRIREAVLEELHCAHPGIVRMKEIARSHVWWPNIDTDIERVAKQCRACLQTRSRPTVAPMMPWIWPNQPWTRIHIDYAQKDKRDYLVVVDSFSKWPEIILMNSTTSSATIKVMRDLFIWMDMYGLPIQLVSDNGPQFISDEFQVFLKMNGVKHVKVAPYHAASNGAAERMVQSFKRSLSASRANCSNTQQSLDRFLLSYRTTKHATTGQTPASLFIGRELQTRVSLLHPSTENKVLNKQSDQKLYHGKKRELREFFPGEKVLVKDFRQEGKWWSGTVIERTAPKSYIINVDDGRVWKRHIDQLRATDAEAYADQTAKNHVEPLEQIPVMDSSEPMILSETTPREREKARRKPIWNLLILNLRLNHPR